MLAFMDQASRQISPVFENPEKPLMTYYIKERKGLIASKGLP